MNDMILTKTRFQHGIWEGVITGAVAAPQVDVMHQHRPVKDVQITETDAGWLLRFPIPEEAIADGVQTIVISDAETANCLGHVTLIAEEDAGAELRTEVELLRAELDLLKRAFRRHCVETA